MTESLRNQLAYLLQLIRGNRWLAATVGFTLAYAAWMLAFRLLVLTLITWFLAVSGSRTPRFEEISDAFGSHELNVIALGSLIFVLGMRWLRPVASATSRTPVTVRRLDKLFVPGFGAGAFLAAITAFAFLLTGFYRYLGFFIQFDEASLASANVVIRAGAIVALVCCEEFIFRHKILGWLRLHRGSLLSEAAAAGATGLLYCAIKMVQFDLGLMHVTTLFLLSIAVSIRAIDDGDFGRGAGFLAGVLVVFHPLMSLPVLGNDFSGLLLAKYQGPLESDGELGVLGAGQLSRVLTGGAGGPLSSLAFQMLLLVDIARGLLRHDKFMLSPPPSGAKSG